MTFEVVASAEFNALLDEAVAFRIDNYGLRSARKLLNAVDNLSDHLADNPHMGRVVEDDADDATPLGWVRVDSTIAAYPVHENHEQVALLKLFSATSNWRRRVLH